MGIQFGYKKAMGFTFGIASGFFIVQLITAGLSSSLNSFIRLYEQPVRYIGSAYILWLAISLIRMRYDFEEKNISTKSFLKGLLLQFVNPKGIVYGLTLYSTFLISLTNDILKLLPFAIFFSMLSLTSVTAWTLFGAGVKKYLRNEKIKTTLNIILCLLLIYSAVDLSGIMK
jgi:cysteine/O-acetylserine efflux protein